MNINQIITKRDITEVVHFTTHLGLTGVLATKALKCKDQLKQEQYLSHILKINTQKELDPGWSGHVHLSLTRINSRLYGISSGKWHPDARWRILAFDAEIITHPEVHFVTTNNAYWQHLKRGKGAAALEALFADKVEGLCGAIQQRGKKHPSNVPTCEQAEVLYPSAISTDYLRRIYVKTPDDENEVAAQLYATGHKKIEVVADPKKFVGLGN